MRICIAILLFSSLAWGQERGTFHTSVKMLGTWNDNVRCLDGVLGGATCSGDWTQNSVEYPVLVTPAGKTYILGSKFSTKDPISLAHEGDELPFSVRLNKKGAEDKVVIQGSSYSIRRVCDKNGCAAWK